MADTAPWEDYAQGPWADYASAAPPTKAPEQSYTALDAVKDYGSAAVRPLVKAVTGLPGMAADATTTLGNLVTGHINWNNASLGHPLSWLGQTDSGGMQLPSTATNQLLDQYTRAPTTTPGKVAEFISTALAGAALPTPTIKNPAPEGFTSAPAPQSSLTGAQQQAAQAGQELGMKLTPGQASGSKALQQLEAKLESQPWTSGPLNKLAAQNQAVLDRTAAQTIGENAPTVDATVLGRASERLGNVFQSVRSAAKQLLVDPAETEGVLKKIDSDFEGLLPNDGSILDNKLVSRLADLTKEGKINGEQLGSLSSKLGKAAYKQMSGANGDRDLGQALYAVKNHVDDLVQNTLSGDEAAAYAAARQQYRSLMQLTSRVGTVNPSTGHVSAGALANYLQQTDRQGFLYGTNQTPLYNAARFAQAFKPVVGNSGTATRSLGLGDVAALGGAMHVAGPAGLALPLAGNLATRAYLSAPALAMTQQGQMPSLLTPAVQRALMGGLLAAPLSEAGQ